MPLSLGNGIKFDTCGDCACLDNFLRPDPMTVPTPIIAGMTVTINPVNLGDTV
jgi:hypothetical protein